jgi:RNA polymerase-interacting CarD/CdnL/TRCF family regulator
VNNGQLNDSEKVLYEEQIALLKEELSYVKRLLEEVLKK